MQTYSSNQNIAYWPLNLMLRELASARSPGGARECQNHRTLDLPLGL